MEMDLAVGYEATMHASRGQGSAANKKNQELFLMR
jgi:hypothetical protein